MSQLILLRHGQSQWNLENRFTGWQDVDLTDQGRQEAKQAAALLRDVGIEFAAAHTSYLKRAIRTLWITLDALDRMWLPIHRSWRLNERHYGALQGLDKAQTAAKHGAEQVKIWRRSYDTPPPQLALDDERHPKFDPRYAHIAADELPAGESLKCTLERVKPYFDTHIAPALQAGDNILIVAHGNSLRAIVKMLDHISNEEILEFNIPTGAPLAYELDHSLRVISSGFLGDAEEIAKRQAAVAAQGTAKA